MISMRYVDEYIQNSIRKEHKLQAYDISEELWDLLKALDKRNLLRKKLRRAAEEMREEYVRIGKNSDRILASFNKFFDMYVDKDKRKRFFELAKEFGLTDKDLSHLLHVQLIFMFLLNVEMFKNFLIFVLRDIKPTETLGNLFMTKRRKLGLLIRQTKDTGETLKVAKG